LIGLNSLAPRCRLSGRPYPNRVDRKAHWEDVHRSKAPEQRSWFAPTPASSLSLIDSAGIGPSARVIDVGGGTSRLVDELCARGFERVTLLDIAATAIAEARSRLGDMPVTFVEGDITTVQLSGPFDLWHDRAVFHFLTEPADRAAYVRTLRGALASGGRVIIATFALDGPTTCSGLPVVRYDPLSLLGELGAGFALADTRREGHLTPSGKTQQFVYCLFVRD